MILAVTLACTMTVTPVLADEVSDLKQKKQETQNQVSNLQTQLNSLMTKISDLENDLIETGEEISQTEEDLKTAQEEQEQQYAAGHQAARHRNKHAPFRLYQGKGAYAGIRPDAGEHPLDHFHHPLEKQRHAGAHHADEHGPYISNLPFPHLPMMEQF